MPELRRISGPYDWRALMQLLEDSFAYMEGRIGPPSSLNKMTEQDISDFAMRERLLVIEENAAARACLFVTEHSDCLYLGKLAVEAPARGRGFAHMLVKEAEQIAMSLALPSLELETRIELTENHAAFEKLGFVKIGETRHEGYEHATSITMRKVVSR